MSRYKDIKPVIKALITVAAAALVIIYPEETAQSTVKSIDVCIGTIIPSMFAFMVISTYIQDSGLYSVIFRPVIPILRHIIRADDRTLSVFLLSMTGGYPVGVKLLKETIAENNNFPEIRKKAENASMFCYCISPTFAVIMIGNGIFGSTAAGVVIYLSDVLACMIMGAVVSRRCDTGSGSVSVSVRHGLADAVNSASRSLFTVCTVIVTFNIALTCAGSVISGAGITIPPVIAGICEISNLLGITHPTVYLIPAAAAISSAGGICVLLQCTAIINGEFSVKKFLLARLPCSALSALFSFIIMRFMDISVTASTISHKYTFEFNANKLVVLILIAMCIIIFYRYDKISEKV